jgi:hypothetical protein
VNELGVPLYGDVFGTTPDETSAVVAHWGETAQVSVRGNLLAQVVVEPPPVAPAPPAPVASTEGSAAVAAAAASKFEARKDGKEAAAAGGAAPPALYTVLEARATELTGGLLGTKQVYAVPSAATSGSAVVAAAVKGEGAGGPVTIALAPEDLAKLSDAELARRYAEEESRAREQAVAARGAEDLSDLLLEQDKKRKRKEAATDGGRKKSKGADFKF